MDNINPLKQNARIQQFLGWFMAMLFPFTAKGIIEITNTPIIAALVYWCVCGILLRYALDKKLPYFHPHTSKVKKEIVILIFATVLCIYLYIRGKETLFVAKDDLVFKAFLFAFLNGSLEQLVWINIFDLAGCKKTMLGIVAVIVYVGLTHFVFWESFIPIPGVNAALFTFFQGIIFLVLFFTYVKTKDITLWSIQHIICNLFAVFMGSLGISAFLYIR